MKIKQLDVTGKKVGEVNLPAGLFGAAENPQLIAQYVHVHRRRKALGTKKTKNRGEVRGGGRKPWRQKGLGRARHGSIRSPIWVGGGHAHALTTSGPGRVRMSRRMRVLALATALSQHRTNQTLHALTKLTLTVPKTKKVIEALTGLGLSNKKTLIVTEQKDPLIEKSAANLSKTNVTEARLLNAYDVSDYEDIVLVGAAPQVLEETYVQYFNT